MFYVYLAKSYKKYEKKEDAVREFARQFSRREKNGGMVTLKEDEEMVAKTSLAIEGGAVEFGKGATISIDEVIVALIRSHEAN